MDSHSNRELIMSMEEDYVPAMFPCPQRKSTGLSASTAHLQVSFDLILTICKTPEKREISLSWPVSFN